MTSKNYKMDGTISRIQLFSADYMIMYGAIVSIRDERALKNYIQLFTGWNNTNITNREIFIVFTKVNTSFPTFSLTKGDISID